MAELPESLFDDIFDAEELALEVAASEQPVPAPEAELPWDKQVGEPDKAYHAFLHFRAQPPNFHSCREAYRDHLRSCLKTEGLPVDPDAFSKAPKHWRLWSSQWGWVERVAAWDREVNRRAHEKLLTAQVEARERHVRLAQAMIGVLTLPVKAAMKAAEDPKLVARLVKSARASQAGAESLWNQVAKLSGIVPSVVEMERLALGLSTESVNVGIGPAPREDAAFAFADRIAASPAATELAVHLLDHLSHTGPRPPLGPSVSGEPGDVVDGTALELVDDEAG